MSEQAARKVGNAFVWKGIQHGSDKVISFIRLLILARLLVPEDFGLLAISLVAVEIMTRVTDIGLVPALVQRERADDIHYNTAWTVGLMRAGIIACAIVVFAPVIAYLFAEPRASVFIQVLALRPLLDASVSIKTAEHIRNLRFKELALIKLPDSLTNTIVAIALAATLGVWALIIGYLAGAVATVFASYVVAPYRPHFTLNPQATRSLIQFGRWIFLSGVIAVLGNSAIRLIISRQLGTEELGIFYLATKLASLPIEIASQVAGEVTFALYARLQASVEKISRAFQSVLTAIFAILSPVCMLLIALAPALVTHLLGSKWDGTAPVIQILTVAYFIGLFGETVVPVLKGIGYPSRVTVLESIQTAVVLVLSWLFTKSWGLTGAALAWLPATTLSMIVCIRLLRNFLPHPFSGLQLTMGTIICTSVVGSIAALGLYSTWPTLLGLFLSIAGALTVVGFVLWAANHWLGIGLLEDIAKTFPAAATLLGYVHSSR